MSAAPAAATRPAAPPPLPQPPRPTPWTVHIAAHPLGHLLTVALAGGAGAALALIGARP